MSVLLALLLAQAAPEVPAPAPPTTDQEIADLKDRGDGMKARWQNEKGSIANLRQLKEKREELNAELERTQRQGNLERAAEVIRLGDADLQLASDEGEGYGSVREWRDAHEAFWRSEVLPGLPGSERLQIDDDTRIVVERFRVVTRI